MLQVSESEKKINELKTTSTPSITEKPVKEESKQKVSEHHPKKKVPRRAATISGGDTSERSSGRKTKGHDRKSGKDYSKTDKKHPEERLKFTTVHGKKKHSRAQKNSTENSSESSSTKHKNGVERAQPPRIFIDTEKKILSDEIIISSPRTHKTVPIESYSKCWDQLEAIAALDGNNDSST